MCGRPEAVAVLMEAGADPMCVDEMSVGCGCDGCIDDLIVSQNGNTPAGVVYSDPPDNTPDVASLRDYIRWMLEDKHWDLWPRLRLMMLWRVVRRRDMIWAIPWLN